MVVAVTVWGNHWSGKHVLFHLDNMTVVATVNSRTAKTVDSDKTQMGIPHLNTTIRALVARGVARSTLASYE